RRPLARAEGRAALSQGRWQSEQAVWAQHGGAPAQRVPAGCGARAQARVPPLLPLGAQRDAGAGARRARAADVPRGEALPRIRGRERPRRGDVSGKLKVGVIGAGGLGYHHVRLFRDIAGAELVGFYDARPERRAQVAKELGVRAFDALDALLAASEAVTIVVP